MSYCGWKKSCTTLDGSKHVNMLRPYNRHGIDHSSTGAGFLRSTVFIWLVVGPPLWKIFLFVNWDDDIPNINGKIQKMATKPPTKKSCAHPKTPHPTLVLGDRCTLRTEPPTKFRDLTSKRCNWKVQDMVMVSISITMVGQLHLVYLL